MSERFSIAGKIRSDWRIDAFKLLDNEKILSNTVPHSSGL